jgi:hypothetical protein
LVRMAGDQIGVKFLAREKASKKSLKLQPSSSKAV